ncbi:hypothetical protein CHARACLAT_030139 [Characodon lateralis]|uniref:Uncharacterized protein n=1 Tax=Characodon lateralis TaxID=208331 RepID=A0ABU7CSL2_9TELE|nr:hypothetical protein [Characodon lateralis]
MHIIRTNDLQFDIKFRTMGLIVEQSVTRLIRRHTSIEDWTPITHSDTTMVTHSLLINTEGVYIPCMGVPDIKLHLTFFRGCFTKQIQDRSLSADLCNHSSALFRIKVLKI